MWDFSTNKLKNISVNKEIFQNMNIFFPFSIATNNEELVSNIYNFSYREYGERLDEFYNSINLVFNGKASAEIADVVRTHMEG